MALAVVNCVAGAVAAALLLLTGIARAPTVTSRPDEAAGNHPQRHLRAERLACTRPRSPTGGSTSSPARSSLAPRNGHPVADAATNGQSGPADSGAPVDLVMRAQAGCRIAFAALWRRYAPTVQGILLTMVSDARAEDLTQDVAVSALRALPTLHRPESFPAWLCAIARNMGRNALKARRASVEGPLDEVREPPAPPQGDPTEADEILAQIRCLPVCYREPLMLRLLLEMSGPEIARQTGMTEGSVRVNLCRGMKLLRRRLERAG